MPSILPKRNKAPAKWRKDPRQIEKYLFVHHFIPHAHHRTRAGFLSNNALLVYSFALLVFLGGVRFVADTFPGVLGYASNIKVSDLLSVTNKERKEKDLNELRLNPILTEAARKKAEDMFKNDYWAHVSPEGKEPWDFILEENYDYIYAGENLAKNFSNSRDVVDAWLNSPSHRENLLSKNYEEVGFAVVNGVLNGYETTLVVQMFGKPRNPSYLATVEEEQHLLSELAGASAISEPTVPIAVVEPVPEAPVYIPRVYADDYEADPVVDLSQAHRIMAVVFAGYLGSLLTLDIWYSKKHGIFKLTGHSFAHLSFLVITVMGMLYFLVPGKIL